MSEEKDFEEADKQLKKEEEKKEVGKIINLNVQENLSNKDKVNIGIPQLNKERVAQVQQAMIYFLLDLKRTLTSAKDVVTKIGFQHLAVTLETSIRDIDVYLNQYDEDKQKEAQQKVNKNAEQKL